jgi:retinol dehydrogenase 12
MSFIKYTLIQPLLFPASYGALTQLFVGTTDLKASGIQSGKFYIPWAREGPMPNGALDDEVAERLWKWLEDVTTERADSQ